ncbi:MAG: ABC transporter ATP-binding protein [Desulfitobacterium sp.]|nr:ABC transporter ATP-binding protein [Desulfitobacterium sp.]
MKEPVLEVRGLTKSYVKNKSTVRAVDSVDLEIMPGESLGLVGESGCGKSTLAKLITRLEESDSGQIFLEGKEITNLKGKELRKRYGTMQMVFQDAVSSFNRRMTIGESILEFLSNFTKLTSLQRQARMFSLLEMVGLKGEYARRYPHQLSGGECQRGAIARAIAVEPKLLICDEATSALDVSVQAQILSILEKLRQEMNLSLLFISHDLALVSCFCQCIAVMSEGRIVEIGKTKDIVYAPKHPYTQSLLDSVLPLHVKAE